MTAARLCKSKAMNCRSHQFLASDKVPRPARGGLVWSGVDRLSGETLVCCREDGEPKQPRSVTHEFAHLLASIKDLPRVRFHDLRHSHATQLLASGVHPKIAQERLGHSTITTTMDLYSHVTDTMQSDAAAKLDAAFRLVITGRGE
jgi:Phage integrase family